MSGRQSWTGVVILGILTVTAFGAWFYGFGVLIDPITTDEGWGTTALGFTYGAAQILTGVGAFAAGRALDRFGGMVPFTIHATLGAGLLFAASYAHNVWIFGLLYAIGGGIIGATGFYSVTASAAARLHPTRPDQAISVLTLVGALSSPIIIPLTAWMVTTWDWRLACRALALIAAAGGALGAVVIGRDGRAVTARPSEHPVSALRLALSRPAVRRMLGVYIAAGMAFASVLVYQVPIMTSAGIGLGAAGVIAGFRGFCQIFGRAGLTRAVNRFGTGILLRWAYVFGAAGVALLLVPTMPTGVVYAVLAGVGFGAAAPLQTMYARAHFGESDLGLLMGLQGAAIGVAGGIGPVVGGLLHDVTSNWTPVVVIALAMLLLASAMLRSATPDVHPPR